MKRSDFLKRLVALPFVGRFVPLVTTQGLNGVSTTSEPVCPTCDGEGYIRWSYNEVQGAGVAYRAEGSYLPVEPPFDLRNIRYQEAPCPSCKAVTVKRMSGTIEIDRDLMDGLAPSGDAFRDALQEQKNRMISRMMEQTRRHFEGPK